MTNRLSAGFSQLAPIFKASEAALLISDMQNDYLKGAPLASERSRRTIAPTTRLLETARSLKLPVFYTRRIYRRDGLHSSPVHRLKNIGKTGITVEGTWGAEIIDELKPRPGEIVVDKIRYSGFFQTPLETLLRGLKVTFLLLTGGSTQWGVEATARDAEQRDLIPIVISDATHAGTDELQEASLRNISQFVGFVVTTDEALRLLSQT